MDVPAMLPEILTTPAGPYFIVQFLKDTYLLSALHSYSDTLSVLPYKSLIAFLCKKIQKFLQVHSMDISLMPLYIYKIPKNCSDILVTPNLMYSIHAVDEADDKLVQEESFAELRKVPSNENRTQAIGVIASNTTELRIGEDAVCILFRIQMSTKITI